MPSLWEARWVPRRSPVAVIGMACRLPGGIDSPEQLWEALLRGDDLVTEIPPDRWDADEYYDPEPGVPGRSVSKWGAFLDDVAGFDSEFFGINEREATATTRSTGCCWKPLGRPWSMPVSPGRRWPTR
jgi:acyl transferase domain-containing protein